MIINPNFLGFLFFPLIGIKPSNPYSDNINNMNVYYSTTFDRLENLTFSDKMLQVKHFNYNGGKS
jgi:hypothetical protein